MNKEKLLGHTLERAINIGFGIEPDEKLEEIFAEKLMVIGTGVEERYTSLDGLRTLIRMQKEQSEGMELSFERTEVYRDIKALENIAIIVEDIWLNIKVNNESTGFGMRASAVLEFKNESWKVIHWHVSKPDNVESEKDTFGIEEWKQKADALEKLVAERTADLVIKNRELEIEAALERVRSRTMAMHKSDELKEIIKVLYEQFVNLKITVEHAGFIIDYKQREDMMIWLADHHNIPAQISIPYFDSPHWNSFKNAKEKELDFFVNHLAFEEKNLFYRELFKLFSVPDDARDYYFNCTGLAISTVLLENVGLYIENFSGTPYTDEENNLLMRFGKVFQQAYTRFLDLQKAEVQALQAEQDVVEIKIARQKAEDALTELQATQKQLIQSEKMASLGELTAGIAHEIQNPLNFVNNFSELNTELLVELKEEAEKGNLDEIAALAKDIESNSEKITHHGKRAGNIVKAMLQHSRSSTSTKEPTDINKLADEYLHLAYHGLRAKDKSFNATLKTNYDESIGNINIISQDIGRVILNLITNAFYAVNEKKLSTPGGPTAGIYIPTVSISTKKTNNKVEIKIADNGNGIPDSIRDKIFQPFFTTKPTGKGTGLGLSLAYDIVKAHGGELKVESSSAESAAQARNENTGSTFKILFPFSV